MPHAALSASPQRVFSVNIGAGSSRRNRIAAAPIVADGRIYTIDGLSGLVATSTSGARLWAVDLTAQFDKGGNVSGGGLAYGGGRLFAASGYGEIVALEPASGAVIWRQRFDAPVMGAPTVDNGVVCPALGLLVAGLLVVICETNPYCRSLLPWSNGILRLYAKFTLVARAGGILRAWACSMAAMMKPNPSRQIVRCVCSNSNRS